MSDRRDRRMNKRSNRNLWVAIGAVILVILLIAWIVMAGFDGDTDVAAMITSPWL